MDIKQVVCAGTRRLDSRRKHADYGCILVAGDYEAEQGQHGNVWCGDEDHIPLPIRKHRSTNPRCTSSLPEQPNTAT